MDKIIKLLADNKSLEFIIKNKSGWCQILFNQNNKTIQLGAHSIDTIKQKFQTVLNIDCFPESTSEVNGKKISWFLTLSETYCSCYATRNIDITELLFYCNESFIATIRLTKDDCVSWSKQLNKFYK